jgi:hypothetical protein
VKGQEDFLEPVSPHPGASVLTSSARARVLTLHLADHPTVPHLDRLIQLFGEWLTKKRVHGFGGPEDGIEQEVADLCNAATNLRNAL